MAVYASLQRSVTGQMLSPKFLFESLFCTYVFDWYVGIILDISIDNGDDYLKFMHPESLSMFLKWPSKEDECWVALNNVIKVLKPPKSNQSGRNI